MTDILNTHQTVDPGTAGVSHGRRREEEKKVFLGSRKIRRKVQLARELMEHYGVGDVEVFWLLII